MKSILKIIYRYVSKQQRFSILLSKNVSQQTLKKIFKNLNLLMEEKNVIARKLGGFGTYVQIDETMLNYKCKSHRGRSTENKTDAITMVEVRNGVSSNAYAEIIANKSAATMIPIICIHVISGSTIFTDEHRTYPILTRYGYIHKPVCHKTNLINPETLVHTQNVESFNNYLKCEIKKRKGIKTINSKEFLIEIFWFWNNKSDILAGIMELIKV
jgi:hypothetical protein